MEKNEDVKKAVVTVREMSEDEKMERLAELRQKAIMDEKALYNTGIREGKELGRARRTKRRTKNQSNKKNAKRKFDNDIIKKYTNATDEEIEEAKHKIKNKLKIKSLNKFDNFENYI